MNIAFILAVLLLSTLYLWHSSQQALKMAFTIRLTQFKKILFMMVKALSLDLVLFFI